MHYKNGREAQNGDKVVWFRQGDRKDGVPVVGILFDAKFGFDRYNGRLAPIVGTEPVPDLSECLHLDDVKAALAGAK